MRPEITAEWARNTAQVVLGEKVKKELNICFDSIQAAVKRNDFSVDVRMYPDNLTIQELNKRGFSTEKYNDPDPRDGGTYLRITWFR